ncbi:bacillithiol biosynthesis cysteine-adding enzyme BshC [Granulicella rosea]|uniref:Putative cysteine ligase BshC n=2 Tax=Granulicella rosea TaxID=474952 RepID=A0A239E1C7_9BACT|nr:bacillithiol biosynthesis cysteine-adding enzyme BshC [Granulicella rosea]
MSVLPHLSALYGDYLAAAEPVRGWYGSEPLSGWMGRAVAVAEPAKLADALALQAAEFGAAPATLANIERLRAGARAVVTGQQVGLFGGPLFTLLKAATAIARAAEAERTTGVPHVPVFWLATDDHDLAEVDQVALLSKHAVETLRVGLTSNGSPVGEAPLGPEISQVLDQASELLGWAPVCDLLRECYEPREGYAPTLGGAFGRLMTRLFAGHGLVVMDAAGHYFHALGASALRAAIARAGELEAALLARTAELESLGYHAQVLVKPGSSLLFLLDATTRQRLLLRHLADGSWKAGNQTFTTGELLQILEDAPERISPNALLRPIFQDVILPTVAYIGGPAEIAYFAQSAVLYQAILGRLTPVLPRLSATLIEPAIGALLAQHELQLPDVMTTSEALAQKLGARAMPIEGKRKIAAVGNAMDAELTVLTEYLASMDESLGRSAAVSGSKMRYQMNRLRRMAATFELQKEASLRKHADALTLNLFPNAHPQERLLAGVWFLARNGEDLVDRFVQEAAEMCAGHAVVRL